EVGLIARKSDPGFEGDRCFLGENADAFFNSDDEATTAGLQLAGDRIAPGVVKRYGCEKLIKGAVHERAPPQGETVQFNELVVVKGAGARSGDVDLAQGFDVGAQRGITRESFADAGRRGAKCGQIIIGRESGKDSS